MACPLGVMHCGDITLPTIVQPAGAFAGSLRTLLTELKLPASSAVVGRVRFCGGAGSRSLFHSSPAKKNSLPRLIGPPSVQPKSLKRKGGRGELVALAFLASKTSLRTY